MGATGKRARPDVSGMDPVIAARVELTVACTDSDGLAKVAGAGDVREHEGQRVQVMHNGVLIEEGCYFGPWMTEIIRCLRGHHEPQEEVVFSEVLARLASSGTDAPTAIELGSFWAYYSLWLLEEFPQGRVLAMEPDAQNLEVGRRNFALNRRVGHFVQA